MRMKKTYIYMMLLGAALWMGSCTKEEPVMPNEEPKEEMQKPYVEGELIVKFSAEAAAIVEQQEATRAGVVTRSGVGSVDEVLDLIGSYELERVFPRVATAEEQTREAELDRWYVVRFSDEYTPIR